MDWGLLEAASSALVPAVYIPIGILDRDTNLTTNSATRKSGYGTERSLELEVDEPQAAAERAKLDDGLPIGMYTSGHDGPAKCARRAPQCDE